MSKCLKKKCHDIMIINITIFNVKYETFYGYIFWWTQSNIKDGIWNILNNFRMRILKILDYLG